MKAKEIDYELMDEWFYYDETSPSCLRWKKDVPFNRTKGKPAGRENRSRGNYYRWTVQLKEKEYTVSRVIWVLLKGVIGNGLVVDHIDHDPLNNTISNLRLVTQSVNNRNARKSSKNTTGVVGVRYDKRGAFQATWENKDNTCVRSFSVKKYGEEEAFRLACQAREEAIKRLNEQGAGYTETHGEELPY